MSGSRVKTSGGLKKSDLKRNRGGSIVSVKKSARAKRTMSPMLKAWASSVKTVSAEPAYVGKFNKMNKSGTFYKKVKALYKTKLEKM